MPVEPVKIPQNVNREDQIVGPITLRQIIISLLSLGVGYALWTGGMNEAGPIGLFVAWTPSFIGIAFAFVTINGISLTRMVLLILERFDKPAIRRWEPRIGVSINIRTANLSSHDEEKTLREKKQTHSVEELSSALDYGHIEGVDRGELEKGGRHPVDPQKIRTDTLHTSIDDIQKQDKPFQDIYPTPHHG